MVIYKDKCITGINLICFALWQHKGANHKWGDFAEFFVWILAKKNLKHISILVAQYVQYVKVLWIVVNEAMMIHQVMRSIRLIKFASRQCLFL